jgi:hypothetical protein
MTERRIPGTLAVEALVRVGLGHDEVVRALILEIGFTTVEAEWAWLHRPPVTKA